MHSCKCNTAMAEVKNISERDTSVLLLFPTLSTEKITEKLKIRHVVSDVSLYKIPLRLEMFFAHHQSHNGSEPLLGSSLLSAADFRPSRVHCMVVVILASRDAWLEVGSPFKASCHWFDRGSFLLLHSC